MVADGGDGRSAFGRLPLHAAGQSDVEYFCDAELAEQSDKDKWKQGDLVTIPASAAEAHRQPGRTVSLGQPRPSTTSPNSSNTTGWRTIRRWSSPVGPIRPDRRAGLAGRGRAAVADRLVGLYVELHSPGVGIGGFVALVCFLLFFWSHYLDGTAGWLEALLFVAGVSCLLLEIFVIPGFGIFGLGGGAMVLASIVLASQTSKSFIPQNEYQRDQLLTSLLTIAAACVGMIVVAVFLRSRLPRSRLFGNASCSSRRRATRPKPSAAARPWSTSTTSSERGARPPRNLLPAARPASATCWSTSSPTARSSIAARRSKSSRSAAAACWCRK